MEENNFKTNDDTKYKVAAKLTVALFEGWEKFGYDENYYKRMVGTISDVIYQCPKVPSSYVSEEAYDLPTKDICREHYYSRTQSAKKMVDLMQKGLLGAERLDRFEKFIKSRARVHYVTSRENQHLIKFQHDPELNHWKKQYEAAGINLRKWDRNKPKYTYDIEERRYVSAVAASEALGVHASTVTKRCESEKWPAWTRSVNA